MVLRSVYVENIERNFICLINESSTLSDAPLVDQPKSQDVQKVLKIMRNKFEAQEDYFPILPSKSPAFLTLVA